MSIVYNALKQLVGWTVAVLAIALALAIGDWPAAFVVIGAFIVARWSDVGMGGMKAWLSYIATCPAPLKVSAFFMLWGFGHAGIPLLVLMAFSFALIGKRPLGEGDLHRAP